MHYLVISFSHKNTDIATREKIAFSNEEKIIKFLEKLKKDKSINEAIVLSTCNRVEIMLSVNEVLKATQHAFELLSKHSELSKDELEGRADVYEDNGAIHHLFAVSSSLDSLVVGETQITGQLKSAYKLAYDKGFCSQKLSRPLHFAFKCAAEVRNSTELSKNPVSVASVAVSKAKEVLGELGGYACVVVGAGEMSKLAAKHLINAGCNVILVNRDHGKAQKLADDLGSFATAEPFSKLKLLVNQYRLLFSATGAPHTVITKDMVEKAAFKRYWFDIAMPRDIEAIEDEDINIYAVDDLQDIVNKNLSMREEQAREAFSIIGRYTQEFYRWLQTLSVDPVIKEIRDQARGASLKELEKAIAKGFLPKEYEEQVTKILHSAFNTFLHNPTTKLKDIAEDPIADTVLEGVKLLFGIDKEVKMINKYKCEHHSTKAGDQ